jgi:hypothetical protein
VYLINPSMLGPITAWLIGVELPRSKRLFGKDPA